MCIAARERALTMLQSKYPDDSRTSLTSKLVIYGTTQTHSLGAKAAVLLGLPFRAIETQGENNWAVTGAEVRAAIEGDEAKGLIPFVMSEWRSLPRFVAGLTSISSRHDGIDIDRRNR